MKLFGGVGYVRCALLAIFGDDQLSRCG